MAKAYGGRTTYYLPEGAPVPDELHPDVVFVGPGAPAEDSEPEPVVVAEPQATSEPEPVASEDSEPEPVRPNVNAPKADWVDYAMVVEPGLARESAEAATKADLVERYG